MFWMFFSRPKLYANVFIGSSSLLMPVEDGCMFSIWSPIFSISDVISPLAFRTPSVMLLLMVLPICCPTCWTWLSLTSISESMIFCPSSWSNWLLRAEIDFGSISVCSLRWSSCRWISWISLLTFWADFALSSLAWSFRIESFMDVTSFGSLAAEGGSSCSGVYMKHGVIPWVFQW